MAIPTTEAVTLFDDTFMELLKNEFQPPATNMEQAVAKRQKQEDAELGDALDKLIEIENGPEETGKRLAEDLRHHGMVVIPVFQNMDELSALISTVYNALCTEFPEMLPVEGGIKPMDPAIKPVLGGFGALGNPSSFHHPVIQKIRAECKRRLVQALAHDEQPSHEYVEMLLDRLCLRHKKFGAVSEDAWHTDTTGAVEQQTTELTVSNTLPSDAVFGGWLNLSTQMQHLSALLPQNVPAGIKNGSTGFAVINKADHPALEAALMKQSATKQYGASIHCAESGSVKCPPGHMILFRHGVVHKVAKSTSPSEVSMRLFTGFRFTNDPMSRMFSDTVKVCEQNMVPNIPSGQLPKMYSVIHTNTDIPKKFNTAAPITDKKFDVRTWAAETFHPAALATRHYNKTQEYQLPGVSLGVALTADSNRCALLTKHRAMPSLVEMGFPAFKYDDDALRVLMPEKIKSVF